MATVLARAAASDTVTRGVMLLAAYSAVLVVLLLLTALGIGQFLSYQGAVGHDTAYPADPQQFERGSFRPGLNPFRSNDDRMVLRGIAGSVSLTPSFSPAKEGFGLSGSRTVLAMHRCRASESGRRPRRVGVYQPEVASADILIMSFKQLQSTNGLKYGP